MSSTQWKKIRQAPDYRSFLQAYLEERGLSLSDFARAAGFGRGFPGDVLSGKRRLTAKSCYAFEKALKLPQPARKLFHLLVAQEEADLFPELDRSKITATIAELRKKSWQRQRRDLQTHSQPEALQLQKILQAPQAAMIYAAAGSPGQGASLATLQKRTQLPLEHLQDIVKGLTAKGLLQFKDDMYEPVDLHLYLQSQDTNMLFSTIFQNACRSALLRAPTSLASEKELFFTSVFCVQEKALPELKAALKSTILKFVDDAIDADQGDRMVNLVTALHL